MLLPEVSEMFSWEAVESFVLIGVITAAIIWYGIALGRREDRRPPRKTLMIVGRYRRYIEERRGL